MEPRQEDEGQGNIFDVPKKRLPWYLGIFSTLETAAIIVAFATTPYISIFDYIFAVAGKGASCAAFLAAVFTIIEVTVMGTIKAIYESGRQKGRQEGRQEGRQDEYERLAKIAEARGVKLPPYGSDRDGKDDSDRKPGA